MLLMAAGAAAEVVALCVRDVWSVIYRFFFWFFLWLGA